MPTDFFDDIYRLRMSELQPVDPAQTTSARRADSTRRRRTNGEFLKGPIPLDWLTRAARLPGGSPLAVALAIWFQSGRRGSNTITLTSQICERFGVNRKAKYRGLRLLERDGLINVERRPQRNPVITLISIE